MPSPDQDRLESLAESVGQLLRRQEQLERRIALLERHVLAAQTPEAEAKPPLRVEQLSQPAFSPAPERSIPAPSAVARSANPPNHQKHEATLETKVGLTLINRVGVITLVLGVAFFFKWAVDSNWIGPAGRVTLGILAGLATLWAADFLWRKAQQAFAQGITGTGLAVLYLAFYSAFGFYHLIPQALAFVLLCCVTSLAFALSLRYDSPAPVALGLVGGYLTPIFLSSGEDHPWFLFGYVLLLDASAMALAKKRSWKLLEVMSAAATALIYGAWLSKRPKNMDGLPATAALFAFYGLFSWLFEPFLFLGVHILTLLAAVSIAQGSAGVFFSVALVLTAGGLLYAEQKSFAYLVSAAFGAFWLAYALRIPWADETIHLTAEFTGITAAFFLFLLWCGWLLVQERLLSSTQHLSVLALNGIVYYVAAYGILNPARHAWLGLLAVAVAGAYLGLGLVLYRNVAPSGENRPLLLSLGMALAFATLAIPIQFTGFTVTIAWSLEAAVLSWIGARFRSWHSIAVCLLVFALVVARLLFIDEFILPDPHTYSLLWNNRFFTFAVASVCLFFAARWNLHMLRIASLWEYFAGHVILLWGLSLEVIAWVERSRPASTAVSAETLSLSILYGLYSLMFISAGVATRTAVNRLAGLILIGLVIVKLYLFDVWQLQRPYRISAFIVLGILLLSTSFLYSRFRPLMESLIRDEKASS